MAGDARLERAREQLKYSTPFWAGGFTRDADGRWHPPAAGASYKGCAKILNKRAKLVTIVPNPWQLEFDDLLEKQRSEGKPMRAIVLKSRKLGFSTWVALKFLQRCTLHEYQSATVVAQDNKTAGWIWEMAERCYSHLPTAEELGLEGFNIRPNVIGESNSLGRKFLEWGEGSKRLRRNGRTGSSVFNIDTAKSPEAGRGATPTMLHLSEVAWWEGEQGKRKMLAMLNALPDEQETVCVLESTANGLNHFYKRWVSARDGAADPDTGESYAHIFVPWWREPAAMVPFATEEDRERFSTSIGDTHRHGEVAEDEAMLVEAYGLTAEQLLWRRQKIRQDHESNVDLFNQEFPHSDEAAFIGSGRTVFGGVLIARAVKAAEQAPVAAVGTLRGAEHVELRTRSATTRVPTRAVWVPSDPERAMALDLAPMRTSEHELLVWEHPTRAGDESPDGPEPVDGAYVVSVDVAGGEGANFTEGDFHAVQVFDHRSRAQVAVHASRMPIEELPEWVLLVGLYYNTALCAPEVNNHGVYVVETLAKTFRYRRMFRRKRLDAALRNDEQHKLGWRTDQVTKPQMEGTFATALADGTAGIRDVRTARELSTYVINEKGQHGATTGEHDDRLVAAMIAQQVMELMRPPRREKREPRRRRTPRDPITGY